MPPLTVNTQELSSRGSTIDFGLVESQSSYWTQQEPKGSIRGGIPCGHLIRRKKTVMFHEVVKAKKTIHISDFTVAETRACWYSPLDLRVMRKDVQFEARVLEDECLVVGPSRSMHLLGMDIFTPKGGKRRNENKKRSQAVVLEEQYLQKEEGSHDPDFIALIYEDSAKACRLASIEAART